MAYDAAKYEENLFGGKALIAYTAVYMKFGISASVILTFNIIMTLNFQLPSSSDHSQL